MRCVAGVAEPGVVHCCISWHAPENASPLPVASSRLNMCSFDMYSFTMRAFLCADTREDRGAWNCCAAQR